MSRYDDITALLNETADCRQRLERVYEEAKSAPDIKEALKPTVKSALEHLRSALEYCGQDVRERYCPPPGEREKVYFPFGEKEKTFHRSIEKNLPKLETGAPAVFSLMKSIQPFACGDRWLVTLCEQTNFNKHNRLSPQERVNSPGNSLRIGGNAVLMRNSSITFMGGSINGVALPQYPVTVSNLDHADEVAAKLGVPVQQEFDWVEFRFERSAQDTLALIAVSHERILAFAQQLQPLL
ncbi:hypothetical protein [Cupriavidus sp. H39]|uniref:hypothetical protein n=1 Tax=Cupriavidus sp. H39 TaxID=3401635 RepID=UPI003CFF9156